MENPQAGWYPDPSGDTSRYRWWDGTQWTENYTPAQQPVQPAQQPVQPTGQVQQSAQPGQYAQPGQNPTVTVNLNQQQQPATNFAPGATYAMTDTDRTLRLVAFVLNILGTLALCWLIIPLAWCIPMTVHSWGIYKGTKANTVAFGVCDLIFCSLIGGILLLISKKDA